MPEGGGFRNGPKDGERGPSRLSAWCMMILGVTWGCMNQQLQVTARRTISGLPDLQYQQVIDNLAAIAPNPGFLPYLAVVGQGSIQVTENGN